MTTYYNRPETFLQVLTETCQLLDKYKTDASVTKMDVIETMEEKLSVIAGKLISMPTYTSFVMYKDNTD
jgi:predicted nucleic acid-binding protein